MKRTKTLATALLATALLGGLASTSAHAAENPEDSPSGEEKAFPIKYTGKSGETKFETVGRNAFDCKKSKTSGEYTGGRGGNIKYDFEECAANGTNCNSSGDAAGIILVKGELLLVYDDLSPLDLAVLTTISPEVEILCGSLLKLKIKGTFLVLFTGITSGTAIEAAKLVLNQNAGKPEDKKYWENSVEHTPLLLTSINGGAFEESAIGSKEPEVSFAPRKVIFTF